MKTISIQLDDDVHEQLMGLLSSQRMTAQAFYEGYTLCALLKRDSSWIPGDSDCDSFSFDKLESLLGSFPDDSDLEKDMKESIKDFLG